MTGSRSSGLMNPFHRSHPSRTSCALHEILHSMEVYKTLVLIADQDAVPSQDIPYIVYGRDG